jgi:hypothetical protein
MQAVNVYIKTPFRIHIGNNMYTNWHFRIHI